VISYNERIILALDTNKVEEAINMVKILQPELSYVKVGMELFYSTGPQIIEELKKLNVKIFLDLKLHDIPNTVAKALQELTSLGVDMLNLHISGGLNMLNLAHEAIDKGLSIGQKRPFLIGVTVLTSIDEQILNNELGITTSLEELVLRYACLAKSAHLAGVVSSPWEVKKIKEHCGTDFLTVTPGIRINSLVHDQKRVTTPKEAFKMGTDYIAIGRSITQDEKPKERWLELLNELEN